MEKEINLIIFQLVMAIPRKAVRRSLCGAAYVPGTFGSALVLTIAAFLLDNNAKMCYNAPVTEMQVAVYRR